MPTESLNVQSGNIRLSVKCYGKADKPVVVLVHGYPDSSSIWDKVVEPLAKNFRVVTYDVRGAGESDVPEKISDYQLTFLMQDLHAVIDAVSPHRPVHVVGHDWGSIQSWESVTEPGAEKRIASYTTISGPCLDHVGYWFRERFGSMSPSEITAAAGQLMHSWYIFLFQLPWVAPKMWQMGLGKAWPKLLENIEGIHADLSPTQTQDGVLGVNLYRANMLQRLLRPRRRMAQVPVQMLVAKKDNFVTPKMLTELAHWTPQLWRREINVTHWLQHSHPQQLATWIGEFVNHIEGGDASPSLARSKVTQDDGDFNGKLVWKVDWPMRWAYERVDFEPGGEDHSSPGSSFTVGKDIVRTFDWQAPSYAGYGFVGLSGSTKMSSSAGQAPTPGFALKVMEPALLRWLYLRRPPMTKFTIHFGSDIWRQYDEWDAYRRNVTPHELATYLPVL